MITTTLEQSQNLKELGAPQNTQFYWVKSETEEVYALYFSEYLNDHPLTFAAYTLDELIEWLGDDLNTLTNANSDEWTAGNFWVFDDCGFIGAIGKGNTPLEAVYALADPLVGLEQKPTNLKDNPIIDTTGFNSVRVNGGGKLDWIQFTEVKDLVDQKVEDERKKHCACIFENAECVSSCMYHSDRERELRKNQVQTDKNGNPITDKKEEV